MNTSVICVIFTCVPFLFEVKSVNRVFYEWSVPFFPEEISKKNVLMPFFKYCTIILGKREANFHLKHRSALMNYMVRIFTVQHSAQLLTRVINT